MGLWKVAFSLFLLMDPIGNIPLYISFLKKVDPKRQHIVIFRELIIALIVIILFNYLGDVLMNFLQIKNDTIQIAGGLILFLICIKMIFPPSRSNNEEFPHEAEPFVVPLAIPLVAGPSVLASVMIYAEQESDAVMVGGILIAWVASLLILLSSSFFKKYLGSRGIMALERLMGLILTLIAVEMFLSGVNSFMNRPGA